MDDQQQTFKVTSKSIDRFIEYVNTYAKYGYFLQRIWVEKKFFFFTTYNAIMYKNTKPKPPKPVDPPPKIEFIIGPIKTRKLPTRPTPPIIDFIIGPISTIVRRNDSEHRDRT